MSTRAPEFAGIENWINSKPLSIKDLQGKVVLIDFWTFSCINCVRTIPYLKMWHNAYADKGLVLLGVHTPEFDFEKKLENIEDAVRRFNIKYPVAVDNNYATWNAYANHYWPAHYLIDKKGQIVHEHFGEGAYEQTERLILKYLGEPGEVEPLPERDMYGKIATPEIYFGLERLRWLANSEGADLETKNYTLPLNISPNFFGLEGVWRFAPEYAELESDKGKIVLNFFAGKVHMVAESSTFKPVGVNIKVDGKEVNQLNIEPSMLYTLYDSENYGPHTLEIEAEKNFKAYTFTFG